MCQNRQAVFIGINGYSHCLHMKHVVVLVHEFEASSYEITIVGIYSFGRMYVCQLGSYVRSSVSKYALGLAPYLSSEKPCELSCVLN